MNGKEWIWLSDIIEILQDDFRHSENDRIITSEEIADLMNDEFENDDD